MTPQDRLIVIQRFILKMPSLSTTVTKVVEVCNNPAVSAYDLNRVIALDPVLSGQVLKLINSAYYSLPNRISSLTRAIIMLGINTVKNLVLATSVLSAFKRSKTIRSVPADDFWAHSLGAGVISKAVAKALGVPVVEQETYFLAGLLHDLGKIPMMGCYPEEYDQAIEMAQRDLIPLHQTETIHMGVDHSQIGRLIAAKWRLDGNLVEAIVNHHNLTTGRLPAHAIRDCVSLANLAAYYFNIGTAGEPAVDIQLLEQLAEQNNLPWQTLAGMQALIEQEIDNAKVFLQTN